MNALLLLALSAPASGPAGSTGGVLRTIALYAAPAVVGLGIVFLIVFVVARSQRVKFVDPVEAEATVVDIRDRHVSRRVEALFEIELEVQPPDGSEMFPASLECYVPVARVPRKGDTVPVEYERGDPSKIVLGDLIAH